jgi:hypothetical protein
VAIGTTDHELALNSFNYGVSGNLSVQNLTNNKVRVPRTQTLDIMEECDFRSVGKVQGVTLAPVSEAQSYGKARDFLACGQADIAGYPPNTPGLTLRQKLGKLGLPGPGCPTQDVHYSENDDGYTAVGITFRAPQKWPKYPDNRGGQSITDWTTWPYGHGSVDGTPNPTTVPPGTSSWSTATAGNSTPPLLPPLRGQPVPYRPPPRHHHDRRHHPAPHYLHLRPANLTTETLVAGPVRRRPAR